MRVIIDPSWTLVDAIKAAYAAYQSHGQISVDYKANVLRMWGNVVGRTRALRDLDDLIREQGGPEATAEWLGWSMYRLKRLQRYYRDLPQDDRYAISVQQALVEGEGQTVEFKATLPRHAVDLAKEIAAFSTSNDGIILLGVNDRGAIVGYEDTRERVEGVLANVQPSPRATVSLVHFGAKVVCIVRVSKGSEPIYYADSRPYIRQGSLSRPATPDEVKHIIIAWGQALERRL